MTLDSERCDVPGDAYELRMSENLVDRLDFQPGMVVQEFGYGDDVDHDLRVAIESIVDEELVDEDYDDVCDAVLVWWRTDDPDLTDLLVDAQTVLDDGGPIWLLTPKAGTAGAVHRGEIEDAARTAGLHPTTTFLVSPDWSAVKLVASGRGR